MFPGGNTGVVRHMLKQLIPNAISGGISMPEICRGRAQFDALDRKGQPARIRLHSTVVSVKHAGEPDSAPAVEILYTRGAKLHRVLAKTVIMAGGSWTAKHVVRDLPAACRGGYGQFYRAPCLMANVAVRNWRFLYDLGLTECQWFEGFGNYLAMRKMATFGTDPAGLSPDSPVVLKYANAGEKTQQTVQFFAHRVQQSGQLVRVTRKPQVERRDAGSPFRIQFTFRVADNPAAMDVSTRCRVASERITICMQ